MSYATIQGQRLRNTRSSVSMIGKALCILLDHLHDNEHTLKITGESSCILKLAYNGSNEMLQTPLTILPSLPLQLNSG